MTNETSEPLWTWEALVVASGGVGDGDASAAVTGVSIDTRTLEAGDLFVALTDARDGHDFVTAAFAKGAAAALVRSDYERKPGDGPLVRVDDPLAALGRIGGAARGRLSVHARVIAITGSAGKTGTKEMLRACLMPLGKTHAPEKSFNNHWGVPLTLARMPGDTKFAVIEMGMNHAGEIAPLSRMTRPHLAIITNVLPVHIGNFSDGEIGIANAKAEIFAGLVPGGIAVLPRDNPHFELLDRAAKASGGSTVGFGASGDATVRAVSIAAGESCSTIAVAIGGVEFDYDIGAPGRHLAENSLAVAATLHLLGLPLGEALRPLAEVAAPAGRGARSKIAIAGGEILLIDESYNANPASMRAALAAMATISRGQFGRRVVVLGDMRELGADSPAMHAGLRGPIVESGVDLVFACGAYMAGLFKTLPGSLQGEWAATSAELVPAVAAAVRPGDAVMIKGSLGTNMAPLVAAVRGLAKVG